MKIAEKCKKGALCKTSTHSNFFPGDTSEISASVCERSKIDTGPGGAKGLALFGLTRVNVGAIDELNLVKM
jgi:hypothetical protein